MALQLFNVLGRIDFTEEKEIKISATAFDKTRPISFSFKFKNKSEQQDKTPIQFAVLLKNGSAPIVLTHTRVSFSSDVEKSLNKFLTMLRKEIKSIDTESSDIDKAVELEEHGTPVDEIENSLFTSQKQQTLREPSSTGEIVALSKSIMIYTKEGNVIVDLSLARQIAENLPAYIKKANKGIVDRETSSWLLKTFSKKR